MKIKRLFWKLLKKLGHYPDTVIWFIPDMTSKKKTEKKITASNRKAHYHYSIEKTLEAGLVLFGSEVKSLRHGRSSIEESYATEKDGAIYLLNSYIPEYNNTLEQHGTRRPRKLLLHKKEMVRLINGINREGITVVPLSLYFTPKGVAKVELGLAKGKKKFEKRASLKEREWKRDQGRLLRQKG